MNLLYRSAFSVQGSEIRVVEEIKKRNLFDHITVITFVKERKELESRGFDVIEAAVGYEGTYDRLPYWDKLPELDGELLNKMVPYKDTIIHMLGIRPYDLFVGTYDELEELYFKSIRYWNYVLNHKRIDMVYLAVIPHLAWEYTLYAVAKCLNIPTLIIMNTHVWGLGVCGTSIEKMGASVAFLCKSEKRLNHTELKPFIDDYLSKALGIHSKLSEKDKVKERKKYGSGPHRQRYLINPARTIAKNVIRGHKSFRKDVRGFFDAQRAQYRSAGIKYYKKYVSTNIKKPYVYLPLQQMPEATTLPWAGVFENQLIGIRLLASALRKCNAYLVIKEHYVQAKRPKSFYDEMAAIPNVICADTGVDSYELMYGCIAVATQTGSCITEAIVKKKPAITFTKAYWSGCQNVFCVNTEKDVMNVIKKIQKNELIFKDEDVEKYMLALENSTIRHNLNYKGNDMVKEEDSRNDVVDLIEAFVTGGCNDEFIFVRK